MAIADDYFGPTVIDVDEWRDDPVRHRYVHGGFEGTDTRFSVYLPEEGAYRERLISFIEGGQGGNENNALLGDLAVMNVRFAHEVGAVLVESNQGHIGADLAGCGGDSSILCWRASAETARFAKQLAAEMYGRAPRRSYVTGGSGGGVRSINCFERTDVWDGAVPFVMPHPGQGVFFSFLADVIRLLSNEERAALAERTGLGGSGDPFEGLTVDQRQALAALYRAGFPRGAEFVLASPFEAILVWSWHSSELMEHDPAYWDEFWTAPGYAGADRPGAFDAFLLEDKTRVSRVVRGGELVATATAEQLTAGGAAGVLGPRLGTVNPDVPFAVVVDGLDEAALRRATGAKLHIQSGGGAGRTVVCLGAVGDMLVCSASGEAGNLLFDGVEPGDEILVTNRDFIAYCHYHRTQTELDVDQFGEHYPEFEQHLVDGRPVYPTRPTFGFQTVMVSSRYHYDWSGKMIICQNQNDVGTWPVGAVNYHRRLVNLRGREATDRDFRLWWFDHAAHIPGSMFPSSGRPAASTRLIDYAGNVQQAMRDLMAWVEDDVEPPRTSAYEWSEGGSVSVADTADERHGIQPVVRVLVDGSPTSSAVAGGEVRIEVEAEVPPGTGSIVSLEWDATGDGAWEADEAVVGDGSLRAIRASRVHRYNGAGTYWPSVRVVAHRDGVLGAATRRVPGLGQARVDIEASPA